MVVLAHISDLHIDNGRRAAERAARVMTFLGSLAAPVDAIVVTGDIADHGLVAEYGKARGLLGTRHRVLLCPGNHDNRAAFRQVLLGEPASDGPINAVHELDGLVIAMCDSTIPGRNEGTLAEETLSWLDGVLAGRGVGRPALVAFHHPPVAVHSPLIDPIRLQREQRLAELVHRHPRVAAILCGHAHTAAASSLADRPVLIAPGVASTLRLPWEGAGDIDESMPPAIAFHVLGDDGRLTTHYRVIL
jgi:3',5'-cyclic AMP phosphodiesterase CpdA